MIEQLLLFDSENALSATFLGGACFNANTKNCSVYPQKYSSNKTENSAKKIDWHRPKFTSTRFSHALTKIMRYKKKLHIDQHCLLLCSKFANLYL